MHGGGGNITSWVVIILNGTLQEFWKVNIPVDAFNDLILDRLKRLLYAVNDPLAAVGEGTTLAREC